MIRKELKELKELCQAFLSFLKVQSVAQLGLSSPHSHRNTNENDENNDTEQRKNVIGVDMIPPDDNEINRLNTLNEINFSDNKNVNNVISNSGNNTSIHKINSKEFCKDNYESVNNYGIGLSSILFWSVGFKLKKEDSGVKYIQEIRFMKSLRYLWAMLKKMIVVQD